jgi:hypothetical protein
MPFCRFLDSRLEKDNGLFRNPFLINLRHQSVRWGCKPRLGVVDVE